MDWVPAELGSELETIFFYLRVRQKYILLTKHQLKRENSKTVSMSLIKKQQVLLVQSTTS